MTRSYRHLPPLETGRGAFAIRCVEDSDIEPIRQWRNAQIEVLRQSHPISSKEQEAYFASAVWPQMEREHPATILVAILRDGERIGYGGLVHCNWEHQRSEISVLFAPDVAENARAYRNALLAFLDMICTLAFERLGLNRLTLETYETRTEHIALLEEAGFVCEGRLREHVLIDGQRCDSLLHAKLASDYAARETPSGGRITSSATRSILVPSGGGS